MPLTDAGRNACLTGGLGRGCSVDGCVARHYAKGLCGRHYRRQRDGRPLDLLIRPTLAERLWRNIQRDGSGCWLWVGASHEQGYGRFHHENRTVPAHRVVYELLTGEAIPSGYDLDHLCRSPACVNPAHLEPVTHRENMRRGYWATKTHCPHGHVYDEPNTIVDPLTGWRECRTCDNARSARRYYSTKENANAAH